MSRDRLFVYPPDAEEQWSEFETTVRREQSAFFDGAGMVFGARAPGQLDILGGVADYSGSIVLEMPIAEATFAAWQWRDDRRFRLRSLGLDPDAFDADVEVALDDLIDEYGQIRGIERVLDRFGSDPRRRWARYVIGCFYVMLNAYGHVSQGRADETLGLRGANILIRSDVPLGAGVSSSAAIEVATMHALSEAAGIHPSDLTLAAWCQRVENTIVGAPCGIMDQVTSAMGRENSILVLKCQPHDLLGIQHLPPGWRFLGIDSGVRHSVGGRKYTRARVGAFMGLKVIQLESGGKLLENYLCRMSPAEFGAYRDVIPETITGEEYRGQYGLLPDNVTVVEPSETYRPRASAEHPILENDRCREFVALMQIAGMRAEDDDEPDDEPDPTIMSEAGRLMYDSHLSYTERLDLGSDETDLLVNLIRDRGADHGLYGARITGGGAGGSVAVFCDESDRVEPALADVLKRYENKLGVKPRLFIGSSPGALMFGAREIPMTP